MLDDKMISFISLRIWYRIAKKKKEFDINGKNILLKFRGFKFKSWYSTYKFFFKVQIGIYLDGRDVSNGRAGLLYVLKFESSWWSGSSMAMKLILTSKRN